MWELQASPSFPLHLYPLPKHTPLCPMPTTPNPLDKSMPRSWKRDSSPTKMQPNYVRTSMSEPETRSLPSSLSPPPLLLNSCDRQGRDSPNLQRNSCPQVHYSPWCMECQMMMAEPHHPTRMTPKKSTPSFGELAKAVRIQANGPYQSPLAWWQSQQLQKNTMEQCQEWWEEQFQRAVTS